jgi:uncharacterized protein
MIQSSCDGNKSEKRKELVTGDCTFECGNVQFTKSMNVSDEMIKVSNDTIIMAASEKTDLFCDPRKIATNTSAPILLSMTDNTKPFTFTVKVMPQFTANGTYSAGGIMAFVDKSHWQKLCFEQDEAGNHRVVTVRTMDVSDDNNHDKVCSSSVFLRFSSDTQVFGNYYSEDGKNWHLVRVYKNEYPSQFYLSLSVQSPKDNAHLCEFSNVEFVNQSVPNFRDGSL